MCCTYFGASSDEDCKRSVRKLERGAAFVFLQTPSLFFPSVCVLYFFQGIFRGGLQEECEEAYKRRRGEGACKSLQEKEHGRSLIGGRRLEKYKVVADLSGIRTLSLLTF